MKPWFKDMNVQDEAGTCVSVKSKSKFKEKHLLKITGCTWQKLWVMLDWWHMLNSD